MSALLSKLWEHPELADPDPDRLRLALRSFVAVHAPEADLGAAVDELAEAVLGMGRLAPLMRDPSVTDVLVNGPHEVWVERSGTLERTGIGFEPGELDALLERLTGDAGVRLDPGAPVADLVLPDGSRMNVVLPPVAPNGPLVSIRRFPRRFTLEALVTAGMLEPDDARELRAAFVSGATVAIAGAAGSGKTTLAGALLDEVPDGERVVVVEETPELRPRCAHWVSLTARPPNHEGRGEVTLAGLVRAALRMRPDRLVVGEVRGPEAAVALDALFTGHRGSVLTLHARSAVEIPARLAALASVSERDPRIAGAFDLFVFCERAAGRRRVTCIERV